MTKHRITGTEFVHTFLSRDGEVVHDDKGTFRECHKEILFMRQHGELAGVRWIDFVTLEGAVNRFVLVGPYQELHRCTNFPFGAPRFNAKHIAALAALPAS
jgi:hypothetical protein